MIKKQTILIVDDAPENIDLLNLILGKDYDLKVALNGKKALEIASNPAGLPDLILLDIMMPGAELMPWY
jgi:putative two-component system response regulator